MFGDERRDRLDVAPGPDPLTGIQVDALATEIAAYGERIDQVIAQARRRVLQGEAVPTADKLFSIFEPHTDLIKRGKAQPAVSELVPRRRADRRRNANLRGIGEFAYLRGAGLAR